MKQDETRADARTFWDKHASLAIVIVIGLLIAFIIAIRP